MAFTFSQQGGFIIWRFGWLATHSNGGISRFRWGEHSDVEKFHETSGKPLAGSGVTLAGNGTALLNGVYQIF